MYPKLQKLIALIQTKIDDRNVLSLAGPWAGDSDYYNERRSGATTKHNALYIIGLQKLAEISGYLGDSDSQRRYLEIAQKTKEAVHALLFNHETGVYDASVNDRGFLSEDANAFALLANLPENSRQRSAILTKLRPLYTKGGCLSFDLGCGYMKNQVVSPIMNGWHAEAALQTPGHFSDALEIWRSCWGPMIDINTDFYSGTHWEFSTPEGKPFMDHFCSMAHPFSSLPVYQFGKYALGLYPLQPGWINFMVKPIWGFLSYLDHAQGRAPTPFGPISVSWTKTSVSRKTIFKVSLSVPLATEGRVQFPTDADGRVPTYDSDSSSSSTGDGIRCAGGSTMKITIVYEK